MTVANLEVYVPFAGSFDFPSVPLARKSSISFASNPSSLRISSLCSPSSGASFAGILVTPWTADRAFQIHTGARPRHNGAVLATLRILVNVARIQLVYGLDHY